MMRRFGGIFVHPNYATVVADPEIIEPLVAKEDDAVVEEGPPDRGHARRVEVGAQVDAVDLGAQRAGDGTDLDRHRSHDCSPGVAQ